MRNVHLILSFFLLLLAAFLPFNHPALQSVPLPEAVPTQDDFTFKHGEELVYKIYYNLNFIWVPAGEVTFKVTDEGNQFHYQAKGKTYSSYEWFFQVKDDYDSWVEKSTYLPNYSERNVNEGGYHIFEKIAFNQSGRKTTVWRAKSKGQAETKTEHPIRNDVHDVLSILYYLRNLEFNDKSAGYTVPFSIFMDQEEFALKMKYLGKDSNKKVHNMGRYRTLKFQPSVIAGNVFNEDSKMTVWVSDDANKIPVLVESPVSVGSVKMTLKSYKGLKYDFTAKVE